MRVPSKQIHEQLASVFGVSRTKIRLALARLSHDGILTTEPNRGTFVSSPTVEQARQVFVARRLLEPALMRTLCETGLRRDQLARLRKNIALEAEARTRNDRHATIRLSGEFHVLLADTALNAYVSKYMHELCSLTCLVIALYDAPGTPACPHHEHAAIVDALEARGVPQYVLTNFSADFWPPFHAKERAFFDRFQGILVSGEVKMLKPDPAIYYLALDRFGLAPGEALFFDDRQINVDGALAVGMHAALFTDAAAMRARLEAEGLL